jgi:hypothetical protein
MPLRHSGGSSRHQQHRHNRTHHEH